nr:MAG TPA: hypothetical protein [Caudoviricetes sp.]
MELYQLISNYFLLPVQIINLKLYITNSMDYHVNLLKLKQNH